MLAIKIWNYFRGYVIIKVEGLTLEKFINLAINRDVYLWDIIRMDYTLMEAKVSLKGLKELENISKITGCKLNVVNERGFPFVANKIKKRKVLALGFIFSIFLIFFLASFIWNIEINGNEEVSDEEICEILRDSGINKGRLKSQINTEIAKNKLLNEVDSFSFVGIEIQGTKLIVEVKEQDLPPVEIDKETPCNIVANKKGVVEKVIAKNGKAIVEKGDVVEKGDILISGTIQDEGMEEGFLVHSEGQVLALIRYDLKIEEPIIKTIKEETGRVYETKEIKFGKKGLQFMNGEIPFMDYVEETTSKRLFGEDVKIPIFIVKHEYKEVKLNDIKQNVESLKESSVVVGINKIMKELSEGSEVISKDVKYSIEGNVLMTKVIVEAIEDIGEKQIIYDGED